MPRATRRTGAASVTSEDTGPTTVLIADDSEAMTAAIAAAVDSDGSLRVIGTVRRVADFLTMARQLQPEVAVIDVSMPGGEGWALARRLRESVAGIRLVAFSAVDDPLPARTVETVQVTAYGITGADVALLLAAIRGESVIDDREPVKPLVGRSVTAVATPSGGEALTGC